MIEQPGFFVWNPLGRIPCFKHETYHSALVEAERLARANPGHDFFVLGALERIKIPLPGTERERVRLPFDGIDELPF